MVSPCQITGDMQRSHINDNELQNSSVDSINNMLLEACELMLPAVYIQVMQCIYILIPSELGYLQTETICELVGNCSLDASSSTIGLNAYTARQ